MGYLDQARRSIVNRVLATGTICSLGFVLSGCGNTTATPAQAIPVTNVLRGIAKGGGTPITGAAITLWQTRSTGYPSSTNPASILATSTTNSAGNFSIDPVANPYSCTPGQYVYITATAGNTGASSVNNQSVLMSALGSCSNFQSPAQENAIVIAINEVTTIAAAYALGNFMYVGGPAGSQAIYITAPASNNSASPGCTGSGATLACATSGLGHAFANAANLVNAVSFTSTAPSGAPYSVSPANPMSSVPVALLNTLAEIIESCVNSSGGLSTDSGGGGRCGSLFTAATSPGGVVPVNTLQAAMNMARYPAHNASTLYGLSSTFSTFQPSLASAPNDLSLAIVYAGTGTTAFGYPGYLALDVSDDILVVTSDAATATMSGMAGLASIGTKLFDATANDSGVYVVPGQASADYLGHVWLADNDALGTLRGINIADGSVYVNISSAANTNPSTPALTSNQEGLTAVGVDHANNLWTCRKNGTLVYQLGYTPGTPPTYAVGPTGTLTSGCVNVSFDTNQNVWFTAMTGTTGAVGVAANLTVGSSASYAATGALKSRSTATLTGVGGTAISSSGVGFSVTPNGVYSETPTLTSNVVSALGAPVQAVPLTLTTPTAPAFDGSGSLFFSDAASNGAVYMVSALTASSGTVSTLAPCYAPARATGCAAVSPSTAAGNLQIDSAGSVWLASGPNGTVSEIIGTAAPASRSFGTVSSAEVTSTDLSVSTTTPQYGTPVTLTAALYPAAVTGSVTFYSNGSALGSATINSGVATYTTSTLPLGTQSITAVYAGTSAYATSTSNAVSVSVALAVTTSQLTSSAVSAPAGTSVTLSDQISSPTAIGMVTFYDAGTAIGTAQVQPGGVATFPTAGLTDASHSFTASYAGNSNFSASTSNSVTVVGYNTAFTYLTDDNGPNQPNAEVTPNSVGGGNSGGGSTPAGSFTAGPNTGSSYSNPYWFFNQTNSPAAITSMSPAAPNCAAPATWSYGAPANGTVANGTLASSICWMPVSGSTAYQVQLYQNGAVPGYLLSCGAEYNNFFGPDNYMHPMQFTSGPGMSTLKSLHLRFKFQLQSTGAVMQCGSTSDPSGDHTSAIIGLSFHNATTNKTLFYQLVMSTTSLTKAGTCTGAPFYYADPNASNTSEYGVDVYYGSLPAAGACPVVGGAAAPYDVDVLASFEAAVAADPSGGLQGQTGDFILSGMYIGSIAFGGASATTTWSNVSVVAYQ